MDRKHRKNIYKKKLGALTSIVTEKDSMQISIDGNKEASIEGHSGISAYDENIVVLKSKGIDVKFIGNDFILKSFTNENVVLKGKIVSIEFLDK